MTSEIDEDWADRQVDEWRDQDHQEFRERIRPQLDALPPEGGEVVDGADRYLARPLPFREDAPCRCGVGDGHKQGQHRPPASLGGWITGWWLDRGLTA